MHYGKKFHCDDLGNVEMLLNQVHTFMTMVFPNSTGVLHQNYAPCHIVKSVQEWFGEHKELMVLPRPQNFSDLFMHQHLWDKLDKQVQSMELFL